MLQLFRLHQLLQFVPVSDYAAPAGLARGQLAHGKFEAALTLLWKANREDHEELERV
jgi:hypothetical protein